MKINRRKIDIEKAAYWITLIIVIALSVLWDFIPMNEVFTIKHLLAILTGAIIANDAKIYFSAQKLEKRFNESATNQESHYVLLEEKYNRFEEKVEKIELKGGISYTLWSDGIKEVSGRNNKRI